MYDKVPALVAGAVMTAANVVAPVIPVEVLTNLPGPSRSEYVGVVSTIVTLLIRELVWWFRNRKA